MEWSYGVTTVPARKDNTLIRTLRSLKRAGFNEPRLFVDGQKDATPYSKFNLPVTVRNPRIRTFGNWFLSMWELYIRHPNADRYALFQDDVIVCRNLREYLEWSEFPRKGYWNLYTFPKNYALVKNKGLGWHKSNQMGLGALALVFSHRSMLTLLSHYHMTERPQDLKKGHQSVDGAIVTTMNKCGRNEFIHNPSLVQHIGVKSTMNHGRFPDADSFPGEDYDVVNLKNSIPAGPPRQRGPKRIGLVGFHCASGLGEKNRQMAEWLDVDRWMVKPHIKYKTLNPLDCVDTFYCNGGRKVEEFVKSVDVILFDETPHYKNLVPLAKRHGKRVVCVAAMEWMPPGGWINQVDLFICPTKQCYDLYHKELPCLYYPWPVDTNRFKPKVRTRCHRFLFLNGRGGWRGRKGARYIKEAKRLWPEMPLLVRSQIEENWPEGTTILPKTQSNADLYTEGDVLVSPHTVDGTGLEQMEALASGMPVINTNGRPWNEVPSIAYIPATKMKMKMKRMIDWYEPDPKEIVKICKNLLGQDILTDSINGRRWAESRAFAIHSEELTRVIREGEPA